MKKILTVISNEGVNIADIEQELLSPEGNGFIPNRVVEPFCGQALNARMSAWYLTDEEADLLKQDPRVHNVENVRKSKESYVEQGSGYQVMDFLVGLYRSQDYMGTYSDFNLRASMSPLARHSYQDFADLPLTIYRDGGASYEAGNTQSPTKTFIEDYHYQADGEGVDCVFNDSPFGNDFTPEFYGKDGQTRFQRVNWAQLAGDPDNNADQFDADEYYTASASYHGTLVMSAAAGYVGGSAKGAHIYNLTSANFYQNSTFNEYDYLIAWHNSKMASGGNQRPTVLIMSVGAPQSRADLPTHGTYRGVPWTRTTETAAQLWSQYGIRSETGVSYQHGGLGDNGNASAHDILLEQCIAAGIHVVIAAGNSSFTSSLPPNSINPAANLYPAGEASADWDNHAYWASHSEPVYYNRPSSPWADGAISVGAVGYRFDATTDALTDENTQHWSARGHRVSLWAHEYAGYANPLKDYDRYSINASLSGDEPNFRTRLNVDEPNRENIEDKNFHVSGLSGTSGCCPLVGGILACILEKEPTLTPAQAHQRLLDVASDTDAKPTGYAGGFLPRSSEPQTYKVVHNPYAKPKTLRIAGNLTFRSGRDIYSQNSTLTVDTTIIKTAVTTTATVSVQLRNDDNETSSEFSALPVEGFVNTGSISDFTYQGSGLYTATVTAPSVGDGSIYVAARLYGAYLGSVLTIPYSDDPLPVITSPSTVNSINDNSGSYQNVYTVTSNVVATYEILEVDDFQSFTINETTGAVTLLDNPDSATKSSYSFTVLAENFMGESSPLVLTLDIVDITDPAVTVTNVNANTIQNVSSGGNTIYDVFVIENSSNVTLLNFGVVDASAVTAVSSDTTNFELLANNNLKLLTPLNFEGGFYQNVVTFTDSAGNSSVVNINAKPLDLDEVAPVFQTASTLTAIDEHTNQNQVVGTLVATDATEFTDGVITYSLGTGSDESKFSINSSTGELTLLDDIEYDNGSTLTLTAYATDATGNAGFRVFYLPINEVYDGEVQATISNFNSPLNGVFNRSVDENVSIGTTLGTVVPTRDDGSTLLSGCTLSLSDTSYISINSSGVISTNSDIDYETVTQFSSNLTVTSPYGSVFQAALNITVNDINEDFTAPVFTSASGFDHQVGDPIGTVVYTATTTDDSPVTYSLSVYGNAYSINSSTGVVTTNTLVSSMPSNVYTMQITATDSNNNTSVQNVTPTYIPAPANLLNGLENVIGGKVSFSGSNYTGAYDVRDVVFDNGSSSTSKLYIRHKVTASTAYLNDTPIAWVQILDSSGNLVQSLRPTTSYWETTRGDQASIPQSPDNLTYYGLASGSTAGRFNVASGTGSSNTGAADGITNYQYFSNVLPSAGAGVISQSNGTDYIYLETSSPVGTGHIGFLRTAQSYTIPSSGIVRICYINTGHSSISPSDTLAVRFM